MDILKSAGLRILQAPTLLRELPRYLLRDYFYRRPRVFISYRRADLPEVAALIYRAAAKTASVFLDVDTIAAGDDFRKTIRKAIASSDFVIAIVGPKWIGPDSDGELLRIQNENDFVRLELEEALRTRKPLMVLHWGPLPPARDAVPHSLVRVLRPKWTNVSERQIEDLVSREIRRQPKYLSWTNVLATLALYAAIWIVAVPVELAIHGTVQKRDDAVSLGSQGGGERKFPKSIEGTATVTITEAGTIYVGYQEVTLTSVAQYARKALDRCLPECDRRVFLRGDRRANPATIFGIVRKLRAESMDVAFVFASGD